MRKQNDHDWTEIQRLLQEEVPMIRIARRIGVHRATLYRLLQKRLDEIDKKGASSAKKRPVNQRQNNTASASLPEAGGIGASEVNK